MRRRGRQWSDDERRRRKARGWARWWLRAAWWASLAFVLVLDYEANLTPPHHLWWYWFGWARWVIFAAAVVSLGLTTRAILLPWWRLLPGRRPSRPRSIAPVAVSRQPIPAGLRFAVLRRDGFRCAYCGRGERERVALHLDHIVPVARGGKTELDNLVTACETCNVGKSASDLVGVP